ncbi:MCE family protein [Nocardia vaccinii]|uniref:MCE family protein n=1 Tax=Nocardia vaccinii TaxID=1822 RepID=UPI000836AC2B|nr:MCE family protein [Nocardia vaccinii]
MRRVPRSAKLFAIVVFLFGLVGCSGVPLVRLDDNEINITAQFDSVAGLYAGNSVSVLGMRLGKVTSIVQKGDEVDVGMSLDKTVAIPADAMAVIVSDSVLTDRHIELTPAYNGGSALANGAVIGLNHTRTPVEFDSVLAMVDRLSKSLGGDGAGHGPIANMVNIGAAITNHNGDDIKSSLDQLAKALQMNDGQRALTRDALTKVIDNLDTMATAAAQNDRTIRDFATGVRQLSDLLADQNFGTGNTGAMLEQILAQATDILQKNRGNLGSTVSQSNVVAKTLSDYNRSIAEFLDVFPLATDNAYAVVDQNVGAVRVHADLDKIVLDGQMVKEVCNLLHMKQLGCDTGRLSDMGPDFGIVSMLAGIAGLPK